MSVYCFKSAFFVYCSKSAFFVYCFKSAFFVYCFKTAFFVYCFKSAFLHLTSPLPCSVDEDGNDDSLTAVDGARNPVVREVLVLGLGEQKGVAVTGEEPVAIEILLQLHHTPHVDSE